VFVRQSSLIAHEPARSRERDRHEIRPQTTGRERIQVSLVAYKSRPFLCSATDASSSLYPNKSSNAFLVEAPGLAPELDPNAGLEPGAFQRLFIVFSRSRSSIDFLLFEPGICPLDPPTPARLVVHRSSKPPPEGRGTDGPLVEEVPFPIPFDNEGFADIAGEDIFCWMFWGSGALSSENTS
jgi:hypothetical protein